MKKKNNLRFLLIVTCFTALLDVFCNIFLISKLYDLAENSNQIVSIYYIVVYITVPLTCLIFRKYFKARAVEAMRCGVVLNAVLIIFVATLNDTQLISSYCIIAILFGVSQAFYYIPYGIVVATYIGENTINYCATASIIFNIANILFPITLGKIIDVKSFKIVSTSLIVIAVLQVLATFKIDSFINKEEFNFKNFFKAIKDEAKFKAIVMNTAKITFFKGINTSVLDRTVLLLIKSMFDTNFELGRLTTLFAIVTISVNYIAKKVFMPKNENLLSVTQLKLARFTLMLSTTAVSIGIAYLVIFPSKSSFIVFRLMSSIFITIIMLLTDVNHYDTSAESGNFKAEFQIFTEYCLNVGRVSALLILLIVDYFISSVIAIDVVITGIAIIVFLHSKMLMKNFTLNNKE